MKSWILSLGLIPSLVQSRKFPNHFNIIRRQSIDESIVSNTTIPSPTVQYPYGTMTADDGCAGFHVAIEGDTIYTILDAVCHWPLEDFLAANPSLSRHHPEDIQVGYSYCIVPPANLVAGSWTPSQGCKKYHTVVQGETCQSIASSIGDVTAKQLQRWNPHSNCSALLPGHSYCSCDGSGSRKHRSKSDGSGSRNHRSKSDGSKPRSRDHSHYHTSTEIVAATSTEAIITSTETITPLLTPAATSEDCTTTEDPTPTSTPSEDCTSEEPTPTSTDGEDCSSDDNGPTPTPYITSDDGEDCTSEEPTPTTSPWDEGEDCSSDDSGPTPTSTPWDDGEDGSGSRKHRSKNDGSKPRSGGHSHHHTDLQTSTEIVRATPAIITPLVTPAATSEDCTTTEDPTPTSSPWDDGEDCSSDDNGPTPTPYITSDDGEDCTSEEPTPTSTPWDDGEDCSSDDNGPTPTPYITSDDGEDCTSEEPTPTSTPWDDGEDCSSDDGGSYPTPSPDTSGSDDGEDCESDDGDFGATSTEDDGSYPTSAPSDTGDDDSCQDDSEDD